MSSSPFTFKPLPKPLAEMTDADWRNHLSPEQYRILRQQDTERPFSGYFYEHKEAGDYLCGACGHKLFTSQGKFDSGCGWPAFDRPAEGSSVQERVDKSHGMTRREVICTQCKSHLGHVFDDGPRETTGQRYCINSLSLSFQKK